MKNPTKALTLNLIPGLGHIYNGKVFRGLFYLIAVGIAAFATLIGAMNYAGGSLLSLFRRGCLLHY